MKKYFKILSFIFLVFLFILGTKSYINMISNCEIIQSKVIDIKKDYEILVTNEKTYSVLLEYVYNNEKHLYKTKLSNCNLGQEISFFMYKDNIYFISDYILYIMLLICIVLGIVTNYISIQKDFLYKKKVLN